MRVAGQGKRHLYRLDSCLAGTRAAWGRQLAIRLASACAHRKKDSSIAVMTMELSFFRFILHLRLNEAAFPPQLGSALPGGVRAFGPYSLRPAAIQSSRPRELPSSCVRMSVTTASAPSFARTTAWQNGTSSEQARE